MKDAALISFRSVGATDKGLREFALTAFVLDEYYRPRAKYEIFIDKRSPSRKAIGI
jgi:hypothetical protein